jgi:hypothetical protein
VVSKGVFKKMIDLPPLTGNSIAGTALSCQNAGPISHCWLGQHQWGAPDVASDFVNYRIVSKTISFADWKPVPLTCGEPKY